MECSNFAVNGTWFRFVLVTEITLVNLGTIVESCLIRVY